MITPRLYDTLDADEQKLWHTHVFEVKSGMLIMPKPAAVPDSAWELAENREMEEVVKLYGKIYHLWQTDRGDTLPLGEPKLMTSYTEAGQMKGGFESVVGDRDKRFGSDWKRKKEVREYIEEPKLHEHADWAWKKGKVEKGDRSERTEEIALGNKGQKEEEAEMLETAKRVTADRKKNDPAGVHIGVVGGV